jgi:transposase
VEAEPFKEQPAMVYGAIDLHLRYSRIRVVEESGRILRESRVVTEAGRLVQAFAGLDRVRIVVESSTESEWVAQTLEEAGHEVVVVDPNFAPMYGDLRRKVKTDTRDVAALAEANRRGWYRAAYRVSPEQRARRQLLRARRHLVQVRTGTISLIRSLVRQTGRRVSPGSSATFVARLEQVALPPGLRATLAPLVQTLEAIADALAPVEAEVLRLGREDPVARRLQTVPGIGPVVAVSFRAFVDDVTRFPSAGHVSAALGLVPREDSSAERRHRGHITKAGPPELRSLLIQAAWVCWRSSRHGPLQTWTDQVAARRGKRIAVVALARRLSRILYALWRDETAFDRSRVAA